MFLPMLVMAPPAFICPVAWTSTFIPFISAAALEEIETLLVPLSSAFAPEMATPLLPVAVSLEESRLMAPVDFTVVFADEVSVVSF